MFILDTQKASIDPGVVIFYWKVLKEFNNLAFQGKLTLPKSCGSIYHNFVRFKKTQQNKEYSLLPVASFFAEHDLLLYFLFLLHFFDWPRSWQWLVSETQMIQLIFCGACFALLWFHLILNSHYFILIFMYHWDSSAQLTHKLSSS